MKKQIQMDRLLKVLPFLYAALIAIIPLWRAMLPTFAAFPLGQLASLLSVLAAIGPLGKGLAAMLLLLPSLPLALYAWHQAGEGRRLERALLVVLAAYLVFALYALSSPPLLRALFQTSSGLALPVQQAMLGSGAWSLFILYVVARLVRSIRRAGVPRLVAWLGLLLALIGAVFAVGLGIILAEVGLALPKAGLTGGDRALLIMRGISAALGTVLSIWVVLRALGLLQALQTEDGKASALADSLVRASWLTLFVGTAATAAINLFQLLIARSLSNISLEAQLPLGHLAFTLAMLLFSRIYAEHQLLREDSQLIV